MTSPDAGVSVSHSHLAVSSSRAWHVVIIEKDYEKCNHEGHCTYPIVMRSCRHHVQRRVETLHTEEVDGWDNQTTHITQRSPCWSRRGESEKKHTDAAHPHGHMIAGPCVGRMHSPGSAQVITTSRDAPQLGPTRSSSPPARHSSTVVVGPASRSPPAKQFLVPSFTILG